jgi:anthranilate/para-aminobenzoate synthase component I
LSPLPSKDDLRSNLNEVDYTEKVKRAKIYINEGDIYQANLAQKFETHYEGNPFELYRKLRKVNPSPFSGYINFEQLSLISSSPERLVKVHEQKVETRPIAGTRPRGKKDEEDRALSLELLLNPKEKAEHLMLVDLERNDLGRICKTGSVCVTDFMLLEKYSHVSHIVSNIVGDLKPETCVYDILKSVFPGGTITGCPKIRCMEIIAELETVNRGPYSGSLGYIGFGRYMDLNIIIRSIIICNEIASFHVGAGIVADSNPQKEYKETLDKAAAMIQALSY